MVKTRSGRGPRTPPRYKKNAKKVRAQARKQLMQKQSDVSNKDKAALQKLKQEMEVYKAKSEDLEAKLHYKTTTISKSKVKDIQCPVLLATIREVFKNYFWHIFKFLRDGVDTASQNV